MSRHESGHLHVSGRAQYVDDLPAPAGCLVALPVPSPLASARILGIDMVWFGVVLAMNLQMSFLTPPFGFSLFYLRGVAPKEMPTTAIYKGALPFICIQAVGLGLVLLFPELVTWGLD